MKIFLFLLSLLPLLVFGSGCACQEIRWTSDSFPKDQILPADIPYGGTAVPVTTYRYAGKAYVSRMKPRTVSVFGIPLWTFEGGSVTSLSISPGYVPAVNSRWVPYGTAVIQRTESFQAILDHSGGARGPTSGGVFHQRVKTITVLPYYTKP